MLSAVRRLEYDTSDYLWQANLGETLDGKPTLSERK